MLQKPTLKSFLVSHIVVPDSQPVLLNKLFNLVESQSTKKSCGQMVNHPFRLCRNVLACFRAEKWGEYDDEPLVQLVLLSPRSHISYAES